MIGPDQVILQEELEKQLEIFKGEMHKLSIIEQRRTQKGMFVIPFFTSSFSFHLLSPPFTSFTSLGFSSTSA